jgi:ribosomal protein L12E/L44/L45/RPP1/RPP2
VDDIKFLRKKLIEMIKLANDYSGSQMEKAIKAFEAKQGAAKAAEPEDDGDVPEPAPKPAAKAAKPKAKPDPVEDDDDSNSPF